MRAFLSRAVSALLLLAAFPLAQAGVDAAPPDTAARNAIALEALSRLKGMDLDANPAVKAAVGRVLDQVRGTAAFVEIVSDFELKDQGAALLDFALANPAQAAGVEAARLLLKQGDAPLLAAALAGSKAAAAAEVLGHTGDKRTVPLLRPIAAGLERDFPVRKHAVEGLARTQEGAAALLELAQQGKLAGELKAVASVELNMVRWPALKAEAARVLPLEHAGPVEAAPAIPELAAQRGDAYRGAGVFGRETVGCFKCHQVNGKGTDFGPNLSEIGTKLAREALFTAILEPSAGISLGYEAWQLELRNGDDPYGLIASETADEVALKTQGGLVTRYKKADIVRRARQTVSIMPTGLHQAMTRQELVDLVEYLVSLNRADAPASNAKSAHE
jgi:putative heme-binding domain-containing protein